MVHLHSRAAAGLVLVCLTWTSAHAQAPATPPPADLDAFMEEVLDRRDVNRAALQQYILDEQERFAVLGPARTALFGRHREFAWYVRDGLHVRSPVTVDGVTLDAEAREAYEREWMDEERQRLERRAKRAEERGDAPTLPETPPAGNMPIAAPRFVSEAYFLDFKFEPGHYLLAGREDLDGQRVVRIEYYPEQMFRDDPDSDRGERRQRRPPPDERERAQEEAIGRKLNKTALITLWIAPDERQIVKYTFDNVWMDFLPGAWLARVDEVHASMVMGQPFPGVWLPRALEIDASFVVATGPLAVEYERTFANYRLAETKSTIRVPKDMAVGAGGAALHGREPALGARRSAPSVEPVAWAFRSHDTAAGHLTLRPVRVGSVAAAVRRKGPAPGDRRPALATAASVRVETPASAQPAEVLRDVLVHGNVTVPDSDVVRLAGLVTGAAIDAAGLEAAAARLRASGLFESVEVRKRYRSLVDESDIAVVLVVHERLGVSVTPSGEVEKPGPAAAVLKRLMFLPLVDYEDGYGWTYGGRVGTHDLFGGGEQITVPLSWGGTREASVRVQRAFASGPVTYLQATTGVVQRENPRYEIDDRRTGVLLRAERQLPGLLRAGVGGSRHAIDFGVDDDRLWTVAADLTLDTRGDPNFPRNAVFARGGWESLHFDRVAGRIDRVTGDARGFLGLIGQSVLAARVRYSGASGTLPPYERLLLGGWASLRGERVGQFEGDRTLVTSAEIRVPLTAVLSSARLGVLAFVDRATAYDASERLADARWHTGAGAGLFLLTPFFRVTLDVAHGAASGDTRVHFGTGFSF